MSVYQLFFIHLHFHVFPNYFGDFLSWGQFCQTINIKSVV